VTRFLVVPSDRRLSGTHCCHLQGLSCLRWRQGHKSTPPPQKHWYLIQYLVPSNTRRHSKYHRLQNARCHLTCFVYTTFPYFQRKGCLLYRLLSLKQLAEFQLDQKAAFKYSSHSPWLSSGPSVSGTGIQRRLSPALTRPTVQMARGKGRRI